MVESAEISSVGGEMATDVFTERLSDSREPSEGLSDDSSESGEWVRKAEAAHRLGVTERTIENRVASGKLPKRVRQDGSVEVLVPKATEDDRTEKALFLVERYSQSVASQLVPVLAQNKELIEKVAAQAETIGELRKENELLRQQLGETEQAKPWWRFW